MAWGDSGAIGLRFVGVLAGIRGRVGLGCCLAVWLGVVMEAAGEVELGWTTPPVEPDVFVIGVGASDAMLHPDRIPSIRPAVGAGGSVILRHGTLWHLERNFAVTAGDIVYRGMDSYQLGPVNGFDDHGVQQMRCQEVPRLRWVRPELGTLCINKTDNSGGYVSLLGDQYATEFALTPADDGYAMPLERWVNGHMRWHDPDGEGRGISSEGRRVGDRKSVV